MLLTEQVSQDLVAELHRLSHLPGFSGTGKFVRQIFHRTVEKREGTLNSADGILNVFQSLLVI